MVGTSEAAASLVPAGFSGSGVSAASAAAGAASGGIGAGTLAVAGGAVAAGAVAVVAASGGGDEPPPTSPTPVATPSPFQRFFGTYSVEYVYVAPSVGGCDGAGSFASTLAGNGDGSGFTFAKQPGAARDPGSIAPDGRFRTLSDNTLWVTEGQTDGTSISGTRSSSICFSQFSGRRQ
jgi:hypothetical protein